MSGALSGLDDCVPRVYAAGLRLFWPFRPLLHGFRVTVIHTKTRTTMSVEVF